MTKGLGSFVSLHQYYVEIDMAEQNENLNNRSLELCRRVVTTESFIAEAKEIYGDRYDYSKVDYKNRDHRVTICCDVHGDFQVYAREHLDGKGCPKCEKRAAYGIGLMKNLSESLVPVYGSNYSKRNLDYYRKFYLLFPDIQIVNARVHNLEWTHVRRVLSVTSPEARLWYLENALKGRGKSGGARVITMTQRGQAPLCHLSVILQRRSSSNHGIDRRQKLNI